MDNPQVAVPRDNVPEWARPDERTRALDGQPPASQAQLNYIRDLLSKKDLSSLTEEQRLGAARLLKEELFWNMNSTRLSKSKAGRMLDALIPLPNKPIERQVEPAARAGALAKLPAGRYAIENNQDELRFYQVWESRDKVAKRLYVQHSDDMSRLPMNAQQIIAQKILDAGVRECAIRYGMEIGSCSNCGRTLTNRISRELGIGPICGGRMFGDDGWKDEVKAKRNEIIARGENPDEDI